VRLPFSPVRRRFLGSLSGLLLEIFTDRGVSFSILLLPQDFVGISFGRRAAKRLDHGGVLECHFGVLSFLFRRGFARRGQWLRHPFPTRHVVAMIPAFELKSPFHVVFCVRGGSCSLVRPEAQEVVTGFHSAIQRTGALARRRYTRRGGSCLVADFCRGSSVGRRLIGYSCLLVEWLINGAFTRRVA
jgi:hypothetical protein